MPVRAIDGPQAGSTDGHGSHGMDTLNRVVPFVKEGTPLQTQCGGHENGPLGLARGVEALVL